MVRVVGPVETDYDALALRVFLKALDILGGPRKLFEYRNLTWLPSLMEASYAVVLKEIGLKTEEEIAQFLGSTKQTVRNMLSADPEAVLAKLRGEKIDERERTHTAGGLAKLAFKEVKEDRDSIPLVISMMEPYLKEISEAIWPIEVLKAIKGMDFPIDKDKAEELRRRLENINVRGKRATDLLDKIEFPVKSPADLLHKLSKASS